MKDDEKKKAISSAGALLQAQRKIYTKFCVVCGKEFRGLAKSKTCGARCRKRKSRIEQ